MNHLYSLKHIVVAASFAMSLLFSCGEDAGTNPATPQGPAVDFNANMQVTASNGVLTPLDGLWEGNDSGATMSMLQFIVKGNCLRMQRDSVTQDSVAFTIDTGTVIHPAMDPTSSFYRMDMEIIKSSNAARNGKKIATIFRINIFGSFTMLELVLNEPGAALPAESALGTNALVQLRLKG